jgi:hypothetical protein
MRLRVGSLGFSKVAFGVAGRSKPRLSVAFVNAFENSGPRAGAISTTYR